MYCKIQSLYKVNISKDQITVLINAVNEEVSKWKNRKLEPIYPFVFADCLYVPIKDDLISEKKAVYVLLGI
ncbi:MAG: transposase, partial [Bacilli bacterium]|nr:transposase [Bacilli bacterium]